MRGSGQGHTIGQPLRGRNEGKDARAELGGRWGGDGSEVGFVLEGVALGLGESVWGVVGGGGG